MLLVTLLRGLLLVVVGIYLIALVMEVLLAEQMIFRPQRAGYRNNAGIQKLTSSDGAKISAINLAKPDATYTILFSHGNAKDIGHDQALLERIRAAGFAVFAYDYQGYGTSEGRPSERRAYDDEDAAYRFLVETMHIQPNRIIAFGRSLGSGPAADLASRRPVAGLILESAFTSAFRVMTRVENRRSNCSLPVDIRLGFRRATSVRFGLVLFPVPAHRTGRADFPHPALGKDSRFRPRKARGPVW